MMIIIKSISACNLQANLMNYCWIALLRGSFSVVNRINAYMRVYIFKTHHYLKYFVPNYIYIYTYRC